jgi:menaquinone-dependent protoporphyrinogen oxidase
MVEMTILVAYASKHGATKEIAERIVGRLTSAGQSAEARPAREAGDASGYDAFVIGGAAYMGHWLKEVTEFVQRNRAVLAGRPVWLFSSGPLGTDETDAKGADVRQAAEPKEFAELVAIIGPHDHRVFFGALNPATLTFGERTIRKLPAARQVMPEGDFRDWAEIEAWADSIAHELAESSPLR